MSDEGLQIDSEELSIQEKTPTAPKVVNYNAYIESHNFGELEKAARDLAVLLESPDLQVSGASYEAGKISELRKRVFDAFCVLCVRAGIELPELEASLYEPFVPKSEGSGGDEKGSRADEIKAFVEQQIDGKGLSSEHDVRTICDFLVMFTREYNETSSLYSSVSITSIVAALNKKLVAEGLAPVRPDYAAMKLLIATEEKAPEHPKKLLIVDDSLEEIVNSVIRVAGWPNVTIGYHLHHRVWKRDKVSEKQQKIEALSGAIAERGLDVVLMDQMLDDEVLGSELIHAMRENGRAGDAIFVANTGGNADDLHKEGAYSNFEKGRSLQGLRRAVLS